MVRLSHKFYTALTILLFAAAGFAQDDGFVYNVVLFSSRTTPAILRAVYSMGKTGERQPSLNRYSYSQSNDGRLIFISLAASTTEQAEITRMENLGIGYCFRITKINGIEIPEVIYDRPLPAWRGSVDGSTP